MSENSKVKITIWQAPYASLREHGLLEMHDPRGEITEIPAEYYLPVFTGEIDFPEKTPYGNEQRRQYLLEKIFAMFNLRHPEGYCSRSLSVGDVVELEGQHYLCAAFGFRRITFQTSDSLRTASSQDSAG